MFESFGDFFNYVKEARFGFAEFGEWVKSLYYSIYYDSNISFIWLAIKNAFIEGSAFLSWVLLFACLSIAFFGHKMIGLLKFVFFFMFGFVLGAHLIAALLPADLAIPPWLVGLIIGLVVSVLYRFSYIALYGMTCCYSVYILCYNGFYINASPAQYTAGKALVSFIIALVVTAIAFVLIKHIEMVGTAILGGWLSTVAIIRTMYDFTHWGIFGGYWWVAVLVVTIIISVLGFMVQFKTRKRY